MRIPIFQLEHKKTYKEEYQKMMKVLMSKCISYEKKDYNYFDFMNEYIFHNWKYRDTYLDIYEYLNSIGVNSKNKKITKESFINFLEFILNMQLVQNSIKRYYENTKYSVKCKSIIVHNIPVLLESYGYEAYSLDDRIILIEQDATYDDLSLLVPKEIEELLISYKSRNNSGIKMKRIILEKLYQYLLSDIDKYKSYNSSLFSSIKTVITKMGVSQDIDKKYQNLTNYKLRKYYDNCYQMILYLIKTEEVLKAKEELKNI